MNFRRILSLLIIAASLFICITQNNFVRAIKCYVCQSNVDPKCADPFDNLTLPITDCDAYPRADLVPKNELDIIEEKGFFAAFSQPPPVKPLVATMCRKIRQKVDGEWRTIRDCGYLGPPGDIPPDKLASDMGHCQMRHGSYDVFMESCTCNNKDGCNGSMSSMSVGSATMIMLMTAVLLHTTFACIYNSNKQQYDTARVPNERQ